MPVVNGLTDEHHPCQALADLMVLRERLGDLEGRRLAWVGDGLNNVCHSLAHRRCDGRHGGRRGRARTATRPIRTSRAAAAAPVEVVDDPRAAVAGAHAVVTDTWTSMGQEDERDRRLRDLAAYQVNAACSGPPRPATSCCTACPPTAARRSPRTCCGGRARPHGTRPRTGCTRRRRSWP